MGRESSDVDHLVLSLWGNLQPDLLRSYVRDVVRGSLKSDGLQQRLQVAVWPDLDKTVAYVDRLPDPQLYATVDALFRQFVDPAYEFDSPRVLKFDPNGQRLFETWWIRLETKNRQSDEPTYLTSHYAKYKSLMPSIALLLQLAADPDAAEVAERYAEHAIQWCRWLAEHARKIYLSTEATSGGVATLADHLLNGDLPSPFTVRQVVRSHWSNLATYEEVDATLNELADLGWVRHQGRRVWQINPKLETI
jgi:putative DNA primase/helicase